jgi:predicted metal-dependent HD superfamily phosphohydrolase
VKTLWDNAVLVLGGTPSPTDLEARYAEAHRGYHNADHVRQVVRDADLLASGHNDRDRAIITLAALAHDVVYDGKPGEDERRSAAWARRELTAAGVAEPDVARVEGLVLATLTHEAGDDPLAAVLLDADLATLGSDDYERYRAAVRAEYAHVTDESWRVGRAAVLHSLLERDPLYATPGARFRWAAKAKTNLVGELDSLRWRDR